MFYLVQFVVGTKNNKTIQEAGKFKRSNKKITILEIIVNLNLYEISNISTPLEHWVKIDHSFFLSCIGEYDTVKRN